MRHFIIVKLKDPKEKETLAAPVKALFDQTLAIPGIHEVKLHLSCSERSNRYDMMIEIIMEPEALAAYDTAAPVMERFFGRNLNTASLWFNGALVARNLDRADAEDRMRRAGELYAALQGPESPMAKRAEELLRNWGGEDA